MATCTSADLRISQNVSNAVVEGDATIRFTEYDRNTNLGYDVFLELVGDDTGYDNDYLAPDNVLTSPSRKRFFVRADGRRSVDLEWRPSEFAWDDLDEDPTWGGDEEIRLLVTVEPYTPVTRTRESNVVILDRIDS